MISVYALILFFLVLILNHIFSCRLREGLETSACSIPSSSPAACQAIAFHKNTSGAKHTQELRKTVKANISKQLDRLSKSIDEQKKRVEKNSKGIQINKRNYLAMNAAVSDG